MTKLHSEFLRLNCKVISRREFHAVLCLWLVLLCLWCVILVIKWTVSVKPGSVIVFGSVVT